MSRKKGYRAPSVELWKTDASDVLTTGGSGEPTSVSFNKDSWGSSWSGWNVKEDE